MFQTLAGSGSATGLALQYILSFSGATPLLSELLKLWDFFLAFGVHMNVICVASQIMLAREQILASRQRSGELWGVGRGMTVEQYVQRDAVMDSQEHSTNGKLMTWSAFVYLFT